MVVSRTLVRMMRVDSIVMMPRRVGEGERERDAGDGGNGTRAAASTCSWDPGAGGGFMAEEGASKTKYNEMRLKVTIVAQTNLSKRVTLSTLVQQVSTGHETHLKLTVLAIFSRDS